MTNKQTNKQTNLIRTIFLFLFSVFLLQGCRSEIETKEKNNSYISSKIDFKTFLNKTNTKKFPSILKIKRESSNSIKNNSILSIFRIDTTNIKALLIDNNVTYSFPAYNYFENPENLYNIVYFKKRDKWNFSLLKIEKDHKVIPIYDSRYGNVKFKSKNSSSSRVCEAYFETTTYHCTGTGSCASGICDQCDLCITITSGMTTYDCSNGGYDGGDTGGSNGGNTGGNTGGGGYSDPSGYTFDPNSPPTFDDDYMRAMYAYSFWKQLSTYYQMWASNNQEIYQHLIENYLDNYSISNNADNLNFSNWAINFFSLNSTNGISNISWEQFQNWFINADGTSRLTFDSSLNDSNAEHYASWDEFFNTQNRGFTTNLSDYTLGTNDNTPQPGDPYPITNSRAKVRLMKFHDTGLDIKVRSYDIGKNSFNLHDIIINQYGLTNFWSVVFEDPKDKWDKPIYSVYNGNIIARFDVHLIIKKGIKINDTYVTVDSPITIFIFMNPNNGYIVKALLSY